MLTSTFDRVAPSFEEQRALPAGVVETVRATIIATTDAGPATRFLDLGAGSGRFGAAFVAAGDDYVGIDLSAGMLQAFAQRTVGSGCRARLVRADGASLPFRDASFDVVLMMHVFGGLAGWRALADEALRVLRPRGAVVVGRTERPSDGLDARMKQRAQEIVRAIGAGPERVNRRDEVLSWLGTRASGARETVAARWSVRRTPRRFIARHRDGARLSALPAALQAQAVRELTSWATAQFGSLDHVSVEQHALALTVFTFPNGVAA